MKLTARQCEALVEIAVERQGGAEVDVEPTADPGLTHVVIEQEGFDPDEYLVLPDGSIEVPDDDASPPCWKPLEDEPSRSAVTDPDLIRDRERPGK